MTRVVGLTGGIGTGKSTVTRMLEELGAVVIDADAIVHELQAPGTPLVRAIAEAFGPEVVGASGALDRKALADRVFGDPEARRRLNALVHPPTAVEMARRLEDARARGVPLVVLDVPLLLEGRQKGSGAASALPLDAVIVVYAPEEVQIERACARDGASPEEVRARLRAQMPIDEKRALADFVVDNTGSREATRRQVQALYRELTGDAAAP